MDRTSQFLNYNVQGGDSGSYHGFEQPASGSQQSYSPGFAAVPFLDEVPSHSPLPAAKSMQPPPRFQSFLPARTSNQLRTSPFGLEPGVPQQDSLLSTPRTGSVKLESPRLSSGSNTTPEARASDQTITPPDMLPNTSQPATAPEAIFPPPAPSPPARRRRTRKVRSKNEVSMDEEKAKRNKFLERNRAAASKCRQKKKEWTSDLEQTKIELEARNAQLQGEFSNLQGEVSRARALLMAHASCHDTNIDKWIENEAKRYVLGAGEQYDTMLAANFGFTAEGPPQLRHESLSSLSGYTTVATGDLLSPTGRHNSVSFPQGIAISGSPVFRRGQVPNDAMAAQIGTVNPTYIISQAMKNADVSDPQNFDMTNSML